MSVARNKSHSRCLDSSRILRGPEGAVIRKADGRAAVGVGKNPEMPPPEPRGGQQSEAGGTRGTAEPRACRGGAAGGPDAQSCHWPSAPRTAWVDRAQGRGRQEAARSPQLTGRFASRGCRAARWDSGKPAPCPCCPSPPGSHRAAHAQGAASATPDLVSARPAVASLGDGARPACSDCASVSRRNCSASFWSTLESWLRTSRQPLERSTSWSCE